MKTILLATLLLFSLNSSAYRSIFGKQSTEWIIHYEAIFTSGFCFDTFYVEKDTIINGLSYKKIIERVPTRCFGGSNYYNGAMREDTVAGKVWYRSLNYNPMYPDDTLDVLAFDFSLQKGDTFETVYTVTPVPDSLKIVDTVYYKNGLKHIQFKKRTSPFPIYQEPLTLIEGITGTYSPIWKDRRSGIGAFYLLCAYQDGIQMPYSNIWFNGACDNHGISVEHITKQAVGVAPIPAADFVQINTGEEFKIEKVTLYDMTGKARPVTVDDDKKLNVRNLPNGIYTLQLISTTGEYSWLKIMVQH